MKDKVPDDLKRLQKQTVFNVHGALPSIQVKLYEKAVRAAEQRAAVLEGKAASSDVGDLAKKRLLEAAEKARAVATEMRTRARKLES